MAGAGLALHGLPDDSEPGWQPDQFQMGHLEATDTLFHCKFIEPCASPWGYFDKMHSAFIISPVLPILSCNGDVSKRTHFFFSWLDFKLMRYQGL